MDLYGRGEDVLDGLFVSGVDFYKNESLIQFSLSASAPLADERMKAVEGYLSHCLSFRNVRVTVGREREAASVPAPSGAFAGFGDAPAPAPVSAPVEAAPAAGGAFAGAGDAVLSIREAAHPAGQADPDPALAPAPVAAIAYAPAPAAAAPAAAPAVAPVPATAADPAPVAPSPAPAAPVFATGGAAPVPAAGGAFAGAGDAPASAPAPAPSPAPAPAATAPAPAKRRGAGASAPAAAAGRQPYRNKAGRKSPRSKILPGSFESSMKGIDFADGAYFEQNPAIVCGAPIDSGGRWAPISSLSVETTEKVAVRGKVVSVSSKPILNGEKHILEFVLSDDTGAIMAKMFVKTKNKRFVEPRISKGACLAVYGAVQYDTFLREPALFAIDIGTWKKQPPQDGAPVKRVELHMHTQMSALDAVSPVGELVKKAAAFGHPAVAVTDHGVVQAFPDAYAAGRKHGIKIIFGVEAYLIDSDEDKESRHIIVLAKNQAGLKNLYKLISKSHLEHFYKRPRMPRAEIDAHREGLILGSACEAGELFRAVAGRQRSRAELLAIASYYDYLEIQPVLNNRFMIKKGEAESLDDLRDMNRVIVSLGEELGKPVAATCDVHFADARDEVFRSVLQAGQGYEDAESQPPLYLRSTAEMLEEFSYLGPEKAYKAVVLDTNEINGWIDEGVKPIPDGTFTPRIEGAADDLKRIVEARAAELYGTPLPPIVRERLDNELDTIISKEFSVMYIIAYKLVKKSNEDGYIVGSRGSVGSSLVATMAGITEVNPLPPHYVCPSCKRSEFFEDGSFSSGFDLPAKACPECGAELARDGQDILFEIFLGVKGSEKAPDIDLNFSSEYQAVAHKYTEEVFGADNVFRAGTIGTLGKKTALGFVKKYVEAKGAPANRAEEERLTDGCTGIKRTTGQHPGGIVVIPRDREIYDFTPVQRPADAVGKDTVTTHFDFNSLHDTILKLDILGHDDPSMIKMLEDLTGAPSSEIPMNDPQILSLFTGTEALGVSPEAINSKVGTFGLPEFGTRFVRQMLVEARPRTFSDLLQISGLSHGTNVWTNNAQELIKSGTCTIAEVIGTRESLVLYLMRKGLEPLRAFGIMEAVRKNKGVTQENEAAMREKGVPDWYIESCKKIEYLFPKAHAAAYVLMAYRQAWYKINRPAAYYAAYFSIRADDFDADRMTKGLGQVQVYLDELARAGRDATPREKSIMTILEMIVEMYARGIQFLPVDIRRSDAFRFTIEGGDGRGGRGGDGSGSGRGGRGGAGSGGGAGSRSGSGGESLRPPLASLSGVGKNAAQSICEARAGGDFLSVEDMIFKSKATKTVGEKLSSYGAMAGLPQSSQLSLFEM
jgi:DNA polymerase-3 subunit alpha (Gram-positive type)